MRFNRLKNFALAAFTLALLSLIVYAQSNVPTIFGGYRDRTVFYGTGALPATCSNLAGDMLIRTDASSPAPTTALYVCTATNTWTLSNPNVNLSRIAKYTATLSPAAAVANTCGEQTGFTVTGVITGDILTVSKPTAQAGLSVAGARVTATNTVAINFCNNTGSDITPTASQTYTFLAAQ